jgi:hypothetical protein
LLGKNGRKMGMKEENKRGRRKKGRTFSNILN